MSNEQFEKELAAEKAKRVKAAGAPASPLAFYKKWRNLVQGNEASPVAKAISKSEAYVRGRRAAALEEKGIELEKKKRGGVFPLIKKIIKRKK